MGLYKKEFFARLKNGTLCHALKYYTLKLEKDGKKEVSGSDLSARYGGQFKCDVVTDLLNTGDDISVVARRHGIGLSTLYTWLSTFGLKNSKTRSKYAYGKRQRRFNTRVSRGETRKLKLKGRTLSCRRRRCLGSQDSVRVH